MPGNPMSEKLPNVAKIIDAQGVTVAIDGNPVLRSASLQAGQGELIGLIGPNGAGKTMLIRALSGLLSAQEGKVYLDGRDMERLGPKDIAKTIALLPQNTLLDFGFTCMEVVLMGRNPHMRPFQIEGSEDRAIAGEAMAFTGTTQFAHRPITTLSGGERQRVLISRALAQQPRLLLLDEPTANLDIQHQLQVMELLRGLTGEGLTVIVAMHDLSLAARFCHRLLLLYQGQVLADGRPSQVLTPENLERAFGIRALTYMDPVTASLTVQALAPVPGDGVSVETPARVHVIGGAGGGGRAMYLLKEAGFHVSAGVLGEGDSDSHTAQMLGIHNPLCDPSISDFHATQMIGDPCPSKPPFAPITPELHKAHVELIRRADCTVMGDIWIGNNNYLNLEAADASENLLLIEERPFDARDYTGGRAAGLYYRLRRRATVVSLSDLVEKVALSLD